MHVRTCVRMRMSMFLLFGTAKCSRITLYISCSCPRISHFCKELWLLLWENGIRNQKLSDRHAHCYWNVIASVPGGVICSSMFLEGTKFCYGTRCSDRSCWLGHQPALIHVTVSATSPVILSFLCHIYHRDIGILPTSFIGLEQRSREFISFENILCIRRFYTKICFILVLLLYSALSLS